MCKTPILSLISVYSRVRRGTLHGTFTADVIPRFAEVLFTSDCHCTKATSLHSPLLIIRDKHENKLVIWGHNCNTLTVPYSGEDENKSPRLMSSPCTEEIRNLKKTKRKSLQICWHLTLNRRSVWVDGTGRYSVDEIPTTMRKQTVHSSVCSIDQNKDPHKQYNNCHYHKLASVVSSAETHRVPTILQPHNNNVTPSPLSDPDVLDVP